MKGAAGNTGIHGGGPLLFQIQEAFNSLVPFCGSSELSVPLACQCHQSNSVTHPGSKRLENAPQGAMVDRHGGKVN
jgi:hypothetical protein